LCTVSDKTGRLLHRHLTWKHWKNIFQNFNREKYNLKYTFSKYSDFKVAGGLPFLLDWGQGK